MSWDDFIGLILGGSFAFLMFAAAFWGWKFCALEFAKYRRELESKEDSK